MFIKLVLTPLSFKKNSSEHQYLLGEWCNKNNTITYSKTNNISVQKYHWSDKKKFNKDFKDLEIIYENILIKLSKKLNKYHGLEKKPDFWRIIIGPWLYFYLISMFDRWESIRIFFLKFNNVEIDAPIIKDDLLKNFGTEDYRGKACYSDDWNNLNFLRIINFKFKNNAKIRTFQNKNGDSNKNIKSKLKINYFKKIAIILFDLFDGFLSSYGIKKNRVILESLYFSKKNLLKLIFKLKIFPCFYFNTFKSLNINNDIELDKANRSKIFFEKNLNTDFENYIFFCFKDDFPISYLEKFKTINDSNKKINSLKNKIIFSGVSQIFNERYKIWLATMLDQGGKFFVVSHGGCIPFDIHHHLFSHEVKISSKIIMSHKPLGPKEFQLSPVHLLKIKKQVNNKSKNCLILSCETLRYPVKIQSWPYVEDYKLWFGDICNLVDNFNKNIKKNVVYRCGSPKDGFETSSQFKKKYPQLRISSVFDSSLNKELNNTKLIVSTYPDTATAEAFMSNLPVVITFSNKLYKLSKKFDEVLNELIKNKVFFSDPKKASDHINEIWEDPYKWWDKENTQKAVTKFKNFSFNVKKNWQTEWSEFIKQQI